MFKPQLKRSIFKHTWLNGSIFGGEHWGFLKEGVKTYQMATNVDSKIANFLFICASIVHAVVWLTPKFVLYFQHIWVAIEHIFFNDIKSPV
jgi:hypothetical protein